jgi:hypothetical protein
VARGDSSATHSRGVLNSKPGSGRGFPGERVLEAIREAPEGRPNVARRLQPRGERRINDRFSFKPRRSNSPSSMAHCCLCNIVLRFGSHLESPEPSTLRAETSRTPGRDLAPRVRILRGESSRLKASLSRFGPGP